MEQNTTKKRSLENGKASNSKRFAYQADIPDEIVVQKINALAKRIAAKHKVTTQMKKTLKLSLNCRRIEHSWSNINKHRITFTWKREFVPHYYDAGGHVFSNTERMFQLAASKKQIPALKFLEDAMEEIDRHHVKLGLKLENRQPIRLLQPFQGMLLQSVDFNCECQGNECKTAKIDAHVGKFWKVDFNAMLPRMIEKMAKSSHLSGHFGCNWGYSKQRLRKRCSKFGWVFKKDASYNDVIFSLGKDDGLRARLPLQDGDECEECGCDMLCYLEGKYAGKKMCSNFCKEEKNKALSLDFTAPNHSALRGLFERASVHDVVVMNFE